MSDIYLAVSETPTVVTLTSAVINSAVASSVTVTNTVTVALDANSLSALENVTVTVGAAITGTVTVGNSLTVSSLPAISGTVTANILGKAWEEGTILFPDIRAYGSTGVGSFTVVGQSYANFTSVEPIYIGGTVTVGGLPALPAGTNQIGSVTASISGTVPISISSVTVGNSVTIGSLPAISGTVTANIAISSSAITSGVFSSLTSATLVPGNVARKMATVFNQGAGQLFLNAGATATTLGGGFMVALSSGDFYECDYTTTTLSAIFATAGTASWVSH